MALEIFESIIRSDLFSKVSFAEESVDPSDGVVEMVKPFVDNNQLVLV